MNEIFEVKGCVNMIAIIGLLFSDTVSSLESQMQFVKITVLLK